MTVVAAQRVTDAGITLAFGAPASAVVEINPDTDLLYVKNAAVSGITATVETPNTVDSLAIADLVVNIGAASEKIMGPFSSRNFKQSSNGKVKITLSSTVTVTIAVLSS